MAEEDEPTRPRRGVSWETVQFPKGSRLREAYDSVLDAYDAADEDSTDPTFLKVRESFYDAVRAALVKSQGIDLGREKVTIVWRAPRCDWARSPITTATKTVRKKGLVLEDEPEEVEELVVKPRRRR